MNTEERNQFIKEEALKLGFEASGVAAVRVLEEERPHLADYLEKNRNASMAYMERNTEKRLNPALLVEGAKTLISVLYNYYHDLLPRETQYKVSMYARGVDYHHVIKGRLQQLADRITEVLGPHEYRIFTDSAPILEKAWARQAGLGWIGKNTCLIHPKKGSWFFIGEIITTMEVKADTPMEERCGNCTRCLDACPTGALTAPGILDSKKCIAYLTIEHRGHFPEDLAVDFHKQVFGCDICQQICPWNRLALPNEEPLFQTNKFVENLEEEGTTSDSESSFKKRFRNTALYRSGEKNIQRNIQYIDQLIRK
ncbi:MAG: tRNA epoxyqueuosine(34) reductase QueG [Bacteroidetes bacterium]|nr:MAG: tRNA epoxyqueuosine(34) reductase QueG [Bacteroidota bacterium]PIE88672.1 MAG: tRNA epoxyqueuosine(34) reductase QueG [Bacteroidota bacterium]